MVMQIYLIVDQRSAPLLSFQYVLFPNLLFAKNVTAKSWFTNYISLLYQFSRNIPMQREEHKWLLFGLVERIIKANSQWPGESPPYIWT